MTPDLAVFLGGFGMFLYGMKIGTEAPREAADG